MGSDAWKTAYGKGKKNRPGINELNEFLPNGVPALFEEFSKYLARNYGLRCKPPVYTESDGWVYSFGRSSVTLLNHVSIINDAFVVQGLPVRDEKGLEEAIKLADSLYADGFSERYEQETAIKNERQKKNTQKRLEREKKELDQLNDLVDKAKFNKFYWSPKLTRQTLKRLYEKDASGIRDEKLLDDVGYTLYTRCLQGRDERSLIESGKMKCHHCNSILEYSRGLIQCQCGYQYLFRDYMRSFRKENMPSGAATNIFNAYIENWEQARDYSTKMQLVDGLVHEFHINLNSGVKGRFVGVNLLDGTKKQIVEFILELAYGSSTEKFLTNLRRE